MPEKTHPSQIERSISRLNETAYLTARTNSDDFRRIISASRALAQQNRGWADDAGYDHGSDVPTDKWMTTVGASVPFDPDFNFQDIGYFLKDALGGYAVAGSGPYIHTFTPQSMNTSRQLPSRTYLEKVGGIDLTRYTSIRCHRLSISSAKVGRIRIAAQYEGSGKRDVDPAGYTSPSVTSDREFGYASQAFIRLNDNDDGTAQVETATVGSGASSSGNLTVTVTSAALTGSPIAVTVAVLDTDNTAALVAEKIRVALRNHLVISNAFAISGSSAAVILTARVKAADDATLNVAISGGSTGVSDAATSAATTAGVAGDYQTYTCALQSWELIMDLPPADDGYNVCSSYVVDGEPRSGQIRSEDLVGARRFTFNFGVHLLSGDKTRDWMEAGTDVTLEIPIVGKDAGNSSLRIQHTRGILEVDRTPEINGFVGLNGSIDLMSNSGSFPLTAVLQNDVTSYSS